MAIPDKLIVGRDFHWSKKAERAGTGIFKPSFNLGLQVDTVEIKKFHGRGLSE